MASTSTSTSTSTGASAKTGSSAARGRSALALAATAGLLLGGAGATAQEDAATPRAGEAVTFALPGDRVFPEGVACDPETGDFFVGSTEDGTIYRGNVGSGGAVAEVFLAPGEDGREAVTGMKVDDRGRLFVAGRRTGRIFVYDAVSGDLIEAFETPPTENTLVNDVALTADAAYFTDSFRPTLFRVPFDGDGVGEPEEWLDLGETPIDYGDGFNLNGIAATPDGRSLLAVHYDRGELYKIDTQDKRVTRVDLGGASLETADGLLLDGKTLYVVLGGPGEIVPVRLSDDLTQGEVGEGFADPTFRDPTTLADCGDGRLLVVNSQLDMAGGGGEPELPFTVSSIAIP